MKKKKLFLKKETIETLNGKELDQINGGCPLQGSGGVARNNTNNAGLAISVAPGQTVSCLCDITSGDCDIWTLSDGGWCLPICR